MGDWMSRALERIETEARETGGGGAIGDLRRAIHEDGVVDAGEIARLLALHHDAAPITRESGWEDLLVEAVVERFALSREAPRYTADELRPDWGRAIRRGLDTLAFDALADTPAEAGWAQRTAALGVCETESDALIAAISANGEALDPVEVRLLRALFSRAVAYPARLRAFTWRALAATVVADRAITADETDLARAIAMGPASADGIAVTRAEADALFAIDSAAAEADKAASWAVFMGDAVAAYVLFGAGSPGEIDPSERAWLDAHLARAGDGAVKRAILTELAQPA